MVRITGAWRVVRVEGSHLDLGEQELHPWNHAPLELPLDTFEVLRVWHLEVLRAQHSHIADGLSGRRLDELQQCIAIDDPAFRPDRRPEKISRRQSQRTSGILRLKRARILCLRWQ